MWARIIEKALSFWEFSCLLTSRHPPATPLAVQAYYVHVVTVVAQHASCCHMASGKVYVVANFAGNFADCAQGNCLMVRGEGSAECTRLGLGLVVAAAVAACVKAQRPSLIG